MLSITKYNCSTIHTCTYCTNTASACTGIAGWKHRMTRLQVPLCLIEQTLSVFPSDAVRSKNVKEKRKNPEVALPHSDRWGSWSLSPTASEINAYPYRCLILPVSETAWRLGCKNSVVLSHRSLVPNREYVRYRAPKRAHTKSSLSVRTARKRAPRLVFVNKVGLHWHKCAHMCW